MAQYSMVEGYFVYLNKESYLKARNRLIEGGLIDEIGNFLNEDDEVIEMAAPPPTANSIAFIKGEETKEQYAICLPEVLSRNIGRVINDLIKGTKYFWFLWSTTDGDYSGSYGTHNLKERDIDMVDWATENKIKVEKDSEDYIQNLSKIETSFREAHSYILPSKDVVLNSTFFEKEINIKGDIVIGEYKNKYLVDTPEGICFIPKKKAAIP